MSANVTAVLFPSLDSMMMSDWLPKLGEKAFMAWLRLHSWKNPSASSPSVELPLSINRIIKRLKVGNSTFYDQILRPLWNYGLIDLKKSDPHKKEQHLILHTYPSNDPAKSSAPLLQIRDYDLEPRKEDSPSPSEKMDPQEDSLPLPDQQETHEAPTSLSSPSSIQEDPSPYMVPSNPKEKAKEDHTKKNFNDFSSVPHLIRKAIEENPELQKRAQSIQLVYDRCKDHPYYDDAVFLQKIHTCLRYPHNPKRFAPYLQKSILNEWNKRAIQPHPSHATSQNHDSIKKRDSSSYRTHDVPEWIRRQQENSPSDVPYGLDPEQQSIIDHLLKELGEI